jgi:hypothetical protein
MRRTNQQAVSRRRVKGRLMPMTETGAVDSRRWNQSAEAIERESACSRRRFTVSTYASKSLAEGTPNLTVVTTASEAR